MSFEISRNKVQKQGDFQACFSPQNGTLFRVFSYMVLRTRYFFVHHFPANTQQRGINGTSNRLDHAGCNRNRFQSL